MGGHVLRGAAMGDHVSVWWRRGERTYGVLQSFSSQTCPAALLDLKVQFQLLVCTKSPPAPAPPSSLRSTCQLLPEWCHTVIVSLQSHDLSAWPLRAWRLRFWVYFTIKTTAVTLVRRTTHLVPSLSLTSVVPAARSTSTSCFYESVYP